MRILIAFFIIAAFLLGATSAEASCCANPSFVGFCNQNAELEKCCPSTGYSEIGPSSQADCRQNYYSESSCNLFPKCEPGCCCSPRKDNARKAECSQDSFSRFGDLGTQSCEEKCRATSIQYPGENSGHAFLNSIHTGPAICDEKPEARDSSQNAVDSGWVYLDASSNNIFVVSDDCAGEAVQCPEGYTASGSIHSGPALCDGRMEAVDYAGKSSDSGWVTLCSKDQSAKLIISHDDCNDRNYDCPSGLTAVGKIHAGPSKCDGKEEIFDSIGDKADAGWATVCAKLSRDVAVSIAVDDCIANPPKKAECTDSDKDGYGTAGSSGCQKDGVDCNDDNLEIHPGAKEICGNGIDEDCSGADIACSSGISLSHSVYAETQDYKKYLIAVAMQDSATNADLFFDGEPVPLNCALRQFKKCYYLTPELKGGSAHSYYAFAKIKDSTARYPSSGAIEFNVPSSEVSQGVDIALSEVSLSNPFLGIGSQATFNFVLKNSGTELPREYTLAIDYGDGETESKAFSWQEKQQVLYPARFHTYFEAGKKKVVVQVKTLPVDVNNKNNDYSFEIEVSPKKTCSDGTLYGSCNLNGKYCDNGILFSKCSECKCSEFHECNKITNKCEFSGAKDNLIIDSIKTIPEAGFSGTVFTISAKIVSKSSVEAKVAFDDKSEIALYDDGKHGDGGANDGIFGNTFDSSGKKSGVYRFDIYAKIAGPQISSYSVSGGYPIRIYDKTEQCIPLISNGAPESKIDLVFISDGYTEDQLKNFENDALTHANAIFSYVPFKGNENKFNVYAIKSAAGVGCKVSTDGIGERLFCDYNKIISTALQCPYDRVIVLSQVNARQTGGIISTSNPSNPLISVHEFGHSFGLRDEYTESARAFVSDYSFEEIGSDGKNCDLAGCPKWCKTKIPLSSLNLITCGQFSQSECMAAKESCSWHFMLNQCIGPGDCLGKGKQQCSQPYCEWTGLVDPYFNSNCIPSSYYDLMQTGVDCLEGIGCYKGCGYSELYYRPINNGIMRSLDKGALFGPVDESIIKNELNKYE